MSDDYEIISSTMMHTGHGVMVTVLGIGWLVTAIWQLRGADPLALATIATILLWIGVGLTDIAKAIKKIGGCDCENTEDTLFHH